MPRARFTVRGLMIAVAVAGLICCAWPLHRRRVEFLHVAEIEDAMAELGRLSSVRAEWIEYHRRLATKYRRAARYPWLSVEPDPPEPE